MAEISSKKRKSLPDGDFADPENRAYPVHDASHARNAMARLEQQKASLSPGKYAEIKRNIRKAYKRFGIVGSKVKAKTHVSVSPEGHVRVRHHRMRATEIDTVVALADDGGKQVWIQIAKVGQFAGHPAGPFELSPKVFDEICRNFDGTVNHRVPVDFEHASEVDPSKGSIPTVGAPAQGWITQLDNRGQDGLWGLVEWGDLAKQYIKQGQYRYLSPAIRFGSRDRVTGRNVGARLTSVGLTNQPFLDGMAPLAASDRLMSYAYSSNEFMPKMRSALGLGDMATAAECKDQLGRLRQHFDMAGGDHMATVHGVDLSSYLPQMRDMMGMGLGCSWEEVFEAVEAMIEHAIQEHVEEYHEGEEPSEDSEMGADMSDKKPEEVKQMSDEQSGALALKDYEEQNAKLSLQLKDAEAKAEALALELSDLRAWKAEKEQKEFDSRLNQAFDTYKDSRKLSDADRKAMSVVLKSDPALFEELYPVVAPAQQHLLRKVAVESASSPVSPPPIAVSSDLRTLSEKFQKEGMSLEDSISAAFAAIKKVSGLGARVTR